MVAAAAGCVVVRLLPARPQPSTVDVEPPDLGRHHFVTGHTPTWTAHRYSGGGCTSCLLPIVDGGDLMSTDEVRRLQVAWCTDGRCFPGGRCRICHVPSGGHDECADCLAASISTDTAHRRAA